MKFYFETSVKLKLSSLITSVSRIILGIKDSCLKSLRHCLYGPAYFQQVLESLCPKSHNELQVSASFQEKSKVDNTVKPQKLKLIEEINPGGVILKMSQMNSVVQSQEVQTNSHKFYMCCLHSFTNQVSLPESMNFFQAVLSLLIQFLFLTHRLMEQIEHNRVSEGALKIGHY